MSWLLGCRLVVDYPGSVEDSGATVLPDTADSATSPTLPEGEAPRARLLGVGAGDRIGEGGLQVVPDLDGDGSDELLVSVPSLQEVGIFELDELVGEVPYSAASAWIEAPGAGHGVLSVGDALAVAAPAQSTVWWLPAGPLSGRLDAAALDRRIAEMRRMVAAMRPSSTASALRILRDTFPDIPFNERIRALRAKLH